MLFPNAMVSALYPRFFYEHHGLYLESDPLEAFHPLPQAGLLQSYLGLGVLRLLEVYEAFGMPFHNAIIRVDAEVDVQRFRAFGLSSNQQPETKPAKVFFSHA